VALAEAELGVREEAATFGVRGDASSDA